ncbi:MAG: SpoIIIAH-like family protein [Bacillota bacterium]|nr:SpoIIIAH-like family protein [Bacillota bacterium]
MLLKKQTVWLLTMLSLVVVLSVYYITSPEQKNSNFANVDQKTKNGLVQKQPVVSKQKTNEKTIVKTQSSDEVFETLRMQLDDQRNQQIEELQQEVATTDLSPDKRSEAYDQMKKLSETAQKEEILETLIKAMGYDDALVRAEGQKVNITVKSNKKPTTAAANNIIRVVRNEIGDDNFVAVEFQPTKQ